MNQSSFSTFKDIVIIGLCLITGGFTVPTKSADYRYPGTYYGNETPSARYNNTQDNDNHYYNYPDQAQRRNNNSNPYWRNRQIPPRPPASNMWQQRMPNYDHGYRKPNYQYRRMLPPPSQPVAGQKRTIPSANAPSLRPQQTHGAKITQKSAKPIGSGKEQTATAPTIQQDTKIDTDLDQRQTRTLIANPTSATIRQLTAPIPELNINTTAPITNRPFKNATSSSLPSVMDQLFANKYLRILLLITLAGLPLILHLRITRSNSPPCVRIVVR